MLEHHWQWLRHDNPNHSKRFFNMTYIIIMTTSIISYLILRYGFGMDDPETFMKSMGIGVIAGIARLVYKSHKREQEIEADAATESSTTTAS